MTVHTADLEAILHRQSVHPKRLTDPAPMADDLQVILEAAMAAPDHKALHPTRFIVFEGPARKQLGALLAAGHRELQPDAPDKKLEKKAAKALRSPMVIAIYAHLQDHPKVPHQEQLITSGCAALQMLYAAEALGYGAALLTGMNVYTKAVHDGLAFADNETMIGLFYVGTPIQKDPPTKPRVAPDAFVRFWSDETGGSVS